MSISASDHQRDSAGRWLPGQSGNPGGKVPGTPNRATMLAAALAEHEGHAIARIVIDKALKGDAVAARFVIGHLTPRPRGRAIALDMPDGARAGDIVAAFNATLGAMVDGEITPDEALTITRVFDGRLKALKAWEIERDLTRREPIPGDEMFYAYGEEDDEDEDEAYEDEEDVAAAPAERSPACGPFDNRSGGQGEGASPANDLHSGKSPHPDPLPQAGEGVTSQPDTAAASVAESPPAPLHSACIQPSPATIAGRRRVAELVRRQWERELS